MAVFNLRNLSTFLFVFLYLRTSKATLYCSEVRANPYRVFYHESNLGDITDLIEVTKKLCKVDANKIFPADELKRITDLGYANQLKHHMSRLKSYSKYGKVDNEDYVNAKKYSALTNTFFDKAPEYYKTQGNLNAEKNKGDCSTVDLRKKMGPVRNQDSVGWCHAFVAADLLSAKTGKRVSAASLAVYGERAANSVVRKPMPESQLQDEGGLLDITIKTGLKKGLCLEEDFPSEYFGNGDLDSKTISDFIIDAELKSKLTTRSAPFGMESIINNPPKFCSQSYPGSIFSMQKTLTDLRDAVIFDSTETTIITDMEKKACEGKRFSVPVSTKVLSTKTNSKEDLFAKVDKQLRKENPVGINYFADFIDEPTATKSGLHSSSIVGRAFNSEIGQCEYLIRNSWGTDCSNVSARFRCTEGHFWVTKGELDRHLSEAVYLE